MCKTPVQIRFNYHLGSAEYLIYTIYHHFFICHCCSRLRFNNDSGNFHCCMLIPFVYHAGETSWGKIIFTLRSIVIIEMVKLPYLSQIAMSTLYFYCWLRNVLERALAAQTRHALFAVVQYFVMLLQVKPGNSVRKVSCRMMMLQQSLFAGPKDAIIAITHRILGLQKIKLNLLNWQ